MCGRIACGAAIAGSPRRVEIHAGPAESPRGPHQAASENLACCALIRIRMHGQTGQKGARATTVGIALRRQQMGYAGTLPGANKERLPGIKRGFVGSFRENPTDPFLFEHDTTNSTKLSGRGWGTPCQPILLQLRGPCGRYPPQENPRVGDNKGGITPQTSALSSRSVASVQQHPSRNRDAMNSLECETPGDIASNCGFSTEKQLCGSVGRTAVLASTLSPHVLRSTSPQSATGHAGWQGTDYRRQRFAIRAMVWPKVEMAEAPTAGKHAPSSHRTRSLHDESNA